MKEEDLQLAENQICSKRMTLDDKIIEMEGVQFFISCITRIEEKTSRALSDEDDDDNGGSHLKTYPGVAYFVAYRETSTCSKEAIFRALHDADMDPTISEIRTRNSEAIPAEEVAAKKIAQVVKDHDSRVTIDLVHMSNRFCREACRQHNTNESNDRRDQPRRYPETPCRLVVVEQRCYGGALSEAHASLKSDGLQSQLEIVTRGINPEQVITAPSDITATIRDIAFMMARFNHALHRGFVYGKPVEASLTFLKMMDVGTYINKLLGNDALRERIVKHKHRIIQLLSHPACEIIRQIEFHPDYVEVSGGKLFQLSARSFTECPPNMELGKISPRMFMPYDSTTPPQPLYFKNAVKNSFPELPERTAFLNKFYQCFVGCRMPHKIRKLVVSGPKDSGKTSWACVFHRIIPSDRIASITKEGKFSASMINDATELVIIDDWCGATMQSDLAKTLLQGGWLVTAVKHQQPKCVWNNSPFYITTNHVPDFGEESENVERRITVFETKSLATTTPGVDNWIFQNAMDCLVWVANEINENIHHVPREERWYEDANPEHAVIDDGMMAR